MRFFIRLIVLLIFFVAFTYNAGYSQCTGLPTRNSIGSLVVPTGLCSPVSADVNYNIGFASPVPAGTLDIIFRWDDGSPDDVIPQVTGLTSYSVIGQNHVFPANSDCEFQVVIVMRYNGQICPQTVQNQKVASWRTDAFNGGNVQLISPLTNTNEHLVCVGQDVNVIFSDLTNFNCNSAYIHNSTTIGTPNIERRWQQIVYNTTIGGSKIPNVVIMDGASSQVTGAAGANLISNLEDDRGVFRMDAPVIINDPRRRPTLQIKAAGGFGAGFPQVGDRFQITIKYWNTCNPYSNDPLNPDVPMNGDLVNGDNSPVTSTSTIRIVDAPPDPTPTLSTVCNGTSPLPNFKISTPIASSLVNWYTDVAGVPGVPITNTLGVNSTTLKAADFPGGIVNSTAGIYTVWASYNANPSGVQSCESKKVKVTLTIKESLLAPILPANTSTCYDVPLSGSVPEPATETFGGPTIYNWTIPADVSAPTTSNPPNLDYTLDFSGITFGTNATVSRVIKVLRKFTTSNACPSPQGQVMVTVYGPPNKGTTAGGGAFCAGSNAGSIKWTPGIGTLIDWEVSTDGGFSFSSAGLGNANPLPIGTTLSAGSYIFHAIIQNGNAPPALCTPIKGDDVTFTISPNPGAATAGTDQQLCQVSLTSNPLGGNTPPAGAGAWSKVSGPGTVNFSNSLDPNATATVSTQGLYKFRWTVISGTCNSQADINVDFGSPPPTPNAGSANAFCGLAGTLAATAPAIGTGKWTTFSAPAGRTAIFNDDTNPATSLTVNVYGPYTFRWTVTSGSCPSASNDVTITFSEAPIANVPADFHFCEDGTTAATLTPIPVTGTVTNGAGAGVQKGHWIIVSGSGSFSSSSASIGTDGIVSAPAFSVNDNYLPSLTDFANGFVQLQLVGVDPDGAGGCTDVNSTTLKITFDKMPTILNAGGDKEVCAGSPASLTALAPDNGATGKWTGPLGITFTPSATTPSATASGFPVGATPTSTTLTWTVTSGLCVIAPIDIKVTNDPLPVVNSLTPAVCEQSYSSGTATITLTDQDVAVGGGNAVEWFTNPVPAGPIASPGSARSISNGTPATKKYYTRVTDNITFCQNKSSVQYTINPLPTVFTFAKDYCEDFPVGNGVAHIPLTDPLYTTGVTHNAPGLSIVSWWEDAAANTDQIATPSDYFIATSTIVYARVKNATTGCESIAPVNLNVVPRPAVQTIVGRSSVCAGTTLEPYVINPIPGASYQWTIPSAFANHFPVSTNEFVFIDFPTVATADLKLVITVNGCQSAEMKKTVDVSSVPGAIKIARGENPTVQIFADAVCENDIGINYKIINPGGTSTFNWSILEQPSGLPGGAFVKTGQTTGNVLLNFTNTNVSITVTENNTTSTCLGPPQTIQVTVNPRPVLADADEAVCSGDKSGITLGASSVTPATSFNITSIAIAPGLIQTFPAALRVTPLVVGSTGIADDVFENTTGGPLQVRYTIEPISATGCPGPAKIVTLTVNPQPVLNPLLSRSICSNSATGVVFAVQVGSFPADGYFIDAITPTADPNLTAVPGGAVANGLAQVGPNAIANDVWRNMGTTPLSVTYSVRPHSSLGCIGNPATDIIVTVFPEPTVQPPLTKGICSDESVNLTLNSSISGSTFNWTVKSVTPGVTGANPNNGLLTISDILSNTTGGVGTVVYTVTAISPALLQSCPSDPQDVTISINPAPAVNTPVNKVICSDVIGGNTAPVDLTAIQPEVNTDATLSYAWFKGGTPISTPASVSVTNNEVYTVVVQAGLNTCPSTAIVNFTINKKPNLTANATQFNGGVQIKCNGDNNGQIQALGNSGVSPYAYRINPSDPFITGTVTGANFGGLVPGTYAVQVKDANGCTNTSGNIQIDEPKPLSFIQTASPALCFNGNTGSIEVTLPALGGGGVAPYTYQLNNSTPQASTSFTGLLAGSSYSITMKDANSCTTTISNIVVDQPTQLMGSIGLQKNISCNGGNDGSVTINTNGGTGPSTSFQYSLGAGPLQGSSTFTPLTAGSYTVTIHDANNCTTPVPVVITEPAPLALTLSNKHDVSCASATALPDGSITVAGTGGTLNYAYSIDNGITYQPSGFFSSLPSNAAGITYHLKVQDAKTCVANLDVVINQPPVLTGAITSQTNVKCNGGNTGSVTVNGGGGSGVYTFSFDGSPSFGSSGTFGNLVARATDYIVTVKDQNLCQVDVQVTITQPSVLTGSIVAGTLQDVSCNGGSNGSVEIAGAGGVPLPYQYKLDNGTFVSSGVFSGIAVGSHSVKVIDFNSCAVDVPFVIGEPSALSANITNTPAQCNNTATGQLAAVATGGTGPSFTYSIDGTNYFPSGIFPNLPKGNYLMQVRDNNGCPFSSPQVITEPTQVIVTVQAKTPVDCFGNNTGTVTLKAQGGISGNYTYSSSLNGSYNSSPTFTGLSAAGGAPYTYFAKDANSCPAQVSFVVQEPTALTLDLTTKVNVFCNSLSTGSIIVQGVGGVGSYTYAIDGGAFTPLNTFNSLAAKASPGYHLHVKDGNGCPAERFEIITQPSLIVVNTPTKTDALCFLSSDGTITISASGGTGSLHYVFSQDPGNTSGQNNGIFTGVRAGTYTVQVTDDNNCTKSSGNVIVGQPAQLKVKARVTSNFNGYGVSCERKDDGVVAGHVVSGGTGPSFTYVLDGFPLATPTNDSIFTDLKSGFYSVSVTDSHNCPAQSIPVYVSEPFTLSAGFIGFDQFVCAANDPAIVNEIVPPFGGIGTYSYQWQSSTDNTTFNNIVLNGVSPSYDPPVTTLTSTTTYYKRIVKSGTCSAEESNVIKVTINPLPTAGIVPSASPVCQGSLVTLNLSFTGQPPFRYDYNAAAASATIPYVNQIGGAATPVPIFNFQERTVYTITRVKDFNGCESAGLNVNATVDVVKIDKTFAIDGPNAQCTGSLFNFKWKVDPDITYTWKWPDGVDEVINANDPLHPPGINSITHKLTNGLTSTSIALPIKLTVGNTNGPGCPDESVQTVTVYPSVNALIPPVPNVICSGTTVVFDNVTQGADQDTWFYRVKGGNDKNFIQHVKKPSYEFTNNSAQNPLVYEVEYIGVSAHGCSDSVKLDMTVYKNSIAHFDPGVVPPLVGGVSNVNFTNNSTIIDATDFQYTWSFGANATPFGYTDKPATTLPVVYNATGEKTVILTVTNKQNAACKTTDQQQIKVEALPFSAFFLATPLADCLPTEITIKNLSGGEADTFLWRLIDASGAVVATSSLNEPKFTISAQGTYEIDLTATLLSTGQTATYNKGGIEVFDVPQASFNARPLTVFVPDTNVETFNFTAGANEYQWDFGDGIKDPTDTLREPSHVYQFEGKYEIVLITKYNHGLKDINGDGVLTNVTCYDTATVKVTAREGGQTKIPNAFTPSLNGPTGGTPSANGVNDVFLPLTRGVEEFQMQIFDRWGTLLFESRDKNQGWDGYDRNGNLLPAGVYVFKLTMRLSNGQRTTQVGDITLLR